MGLFEQQPLLLVPFVLVVAIGYDCAKWILRRTVLSRVVGIDVKR
jgi:hypothetical protein